MVRYKYEGHGERIFPSVPIVASYGDEFEGPSGLTAPGLKVITAIKEEKKKEKEAVKPSEIDTTVGDDING
jgi:hypothetical protein